VSTERDIQAFNPVLAVYTGRKKDGKDVDGTIMMVGLIVGAETRGLVMGTDGVVRAIERHMRWEGIEDWEIEMNPVVVDAYLKRLIRNEEEKTQELQAGMDEA
jgi:hypothetical protein